MSEWISVKERMPDAEDERLWCHIVPRDPYYFDVPGYEHWTGKANFNPFQKEVKTFRMIDGTIAFNCGSRESVAYWMPLPDPPAPASQPEKG